eukprot:9584326-Ditylum_brightwellii.AAC.1
MDKQKVGYCYSDVMSFTLKMYNSQKSLGDWKNKNAPEKRKTKEDTQYLALLSQMDTITKSVGRPKPAKNNDEDGKGIPREAYSSWIYQNPDSKATMHKRNYMLKWYTNNCHTHPMWCSQNNCLSHEEYQKKREGEGKGGATDKKKKRDNFKVTPLALLSDNNFKLIKEQFLN